MLKSKLLYGTFILSLVLSLNVEAKLYKWVDDQGITHYGEIIPPEYANKERESLKKSGIIEKSAEKISPETIREKEESDAKKRVELKAELEQKRRDSALLNTYSNEKEIDMARDRSLELINARIDSNKTLLKSTQSTLDEHKKEVDTRTKQGKKIPQSLIDDIAQTEGRVAKFTSDISKNEEELAAVKMRFDNEKELYRKLKKDAYKK
jgi:hypothetical protein